MFDILIRGGRVIDGTGNVWFRGDVAIEGENLKVLRGDSSSVQADRVIDASGCIVCPGFIDMHTHSDLMALAEPRNEPKLMQGVCTEAIGMDGQGYAPLSKANLEMMKFCRSGSNGNPKLDAQWSSVREYLQQYYHKTSGNIAFLIPNAAIRVEAIGWGNRPATTSEMEKMKDAVRKGMEEGAFGLSTGLSYPPSIWADTDELVELCKVVAECGGIYVTHARTKLGDQAYDCFKEALEIGRKSGVPVHISHYATKPNTRGKPEKLLQIIDDARALGIDVTFDAYPYDAGSSSLTLLLPLWVKDGDPYTLLERVKSREVRDKIRQKQDAYFWNVGEMIMCGVRTEKNKWCEGLSIEEIAHKLNKDYLDTICDLIVDEDLETSFYQVIGHYPDIEALMQHSVHMFCSDGLLNGGKPHPRAYGTFPKILGYYVREKGVLTLERAIRKMTSCGAQRLGLSDRGILRDGMKADIVVFNPDTVKEMATLAEPKQFPIGIEYVFVNGQLVVEKGTHTGALPGRALLKGE